MKKTFWSELSFWIHTPFFILFILPFFISSSLWSSREIFHFGYISFVISVNFFLGIFIYSKTGAFELACPLTSLTQKLRGYSFYDEKNYKHSFVGEIFERFRIKKVNLKLVNGILLVLYLYIIINLFVF
jgi:hypothetical protein